MKALLIIYLLCYSLFSNGQLLYNPVMTPYMINPASLARFSKATTSIYGERRFMLKELSNYILTVALPTNSGGLGLKASLYGFHDYRESRIGIAYGKSLSDKFDVGTQLDYHTIAIPGYGTTLAVGFEVAMLLYLSEKLNTGIHMINPMGAKFEKAQTGRMPVIYNSVIGYRPSQEFSLNVEIRKEENRPVDINAGIKYKWDSQFIITGTISSATSSVGIGLGFARPSMLIHIITGYHPRLGITPGLLIEFSKL